MDVIPFSRWYLLIGILLILLVIVGPRVRRLPLTTTMLYLGLGWLFGVLGWVTLDPLQHSSLLERLSEIAVIVSLFVLHGITVTPLMQRYQQQREDVR